MIDDVINIRFYLYRQSSKWWNLSMVLATITPLASIYAFWNQNNLILYIIGLLALVTPIGIAWTREIANTYFLRADKCRRLILLQNGLGWLPSKEDLAEARSWAMNVTLKKAPFVEPYYSSSKPVGANRLADIIAESTFFTMNLAGKASLGYLILCLGAALAVAMILDMVGNWTLIKGNAYLLIAKSIAVIISFLISGDFLLLTKKYYDLKVAADRVFQRCASIREQKKIGPDVILPIIEDYGIALIQAPPIPDWLYKHYRAELNRIYRLSHGHAEENA